MSFGVDISYATQAFDDASYDTKVTRLCRRRWPFRWARIRASVYYELSNNEILNVDADSSPIIQAEAGHRIAQCLGYRYTLDCCAAG